MFTLCLLPCFLPFFYIDNDDEVELIRLNSSFLPSSLTSLPISLIAFLKMFLICYLSSRSRRYTRYPFSPFSSPSLIIFSSSYSGSFLSSRFLEFLFSFSSLIFPISPSLIILSLIISPSIIPSSIISSSIFSSSITPFSIIPFSIPYSLISPRT